MIWMRFVTIILVIGLILFYAMLYLLVFIYHQKRKNKEVIYWQKTSCVNNGLCDPVDYFEMIEECKKCGKIA